ncbi:MAG: YajQ family cyclic di-GMP-binding protein [Ottowia sp.]|nr:YajQ family cyclic di-GMP-binding protein [Ottowia sp.]
MPSFDAVCEPDMVEVKNAFDNAAREVGTRFDFKGTPAAIELKGQEITLVGSAEFQLKQLEDIVRAKLARRGVDARFLQVAAPQKAGGDTLRQVITVRSGIDRADAKKMQKMLRDSKLKVQPAIQGDALRVSGAKRDTLQEAIALLKNGMPDLPLTFINFRD